jgi:hypothetical protein
MSQKTRRPISNMNQIVEKEKSLIKKSMEVKYEVIIAQLPKNIVAMVLKNEIKSMSQLKEMGKEIWQHVK